MKPNQPCSFELNVSCWKCDTATKVQFQFTDSNKSEKVELNCTKCKLELIAIAHIDTYLIRD